MTPGQRALVKTLVVVGAVVALVLLFPTILKMVEAAARSLRVFWWVIVGVALALWLLWSLGRKR